MARKQVREEPPFQDLLNTATGPDVTDIVGSLLTWWQQHSRDFVWREWKEPYRLLVIEVLLRQTRAESVAAYLPEFLRRYPSPEALTVVTEDELAAVLKPLGFNQQRAAQLRALAAQIIATGGKVPSDMEDLLALPGVGKYTAGMVAAVAFGSQVAAVDTNVARVICRVFGIKPSHAEARKSRNVWEIATELVAAHPEEPAKITWALLDLAAAVCLPRTPDCARCPLQDACFYARRQM